MTLPPISHASVEAQAAMVKSAERAALRAEELRASTRPKPNEPPKPTPRMVPKRGPKPRPKPKPRQSTAPAPGSVVLSRREWQAVENLLASHPQTERLVK